MLSILIWSKLKETLSSQGYFFLFLSLSLYFSLSLLHSSTLMYSCIHSLVYITHVTVEKAVSVHEVYVCVEREREREREREKEKKKMQYDLTYVVVEFDCENLFFFGYTDGCVIQVILMQSVN